MSPIIGRSPRIAPQRQHPAAALPRSATFPTLGLGLGLTMLLPATSRRRPGLITSRPPQSHEAAGTVLFDFDFSLEVVAHEVYVPGPRPEG